MKLQTKRIYEPPESSDGRRILVDRLWPRGLSKADARIDFWAKTAAPSNELRKWYQHDPEKWDEFKRRYFAELEAAPQAVAELLGEVRGDKVSFVYSSKERELNNATALLQFIEARL